MTADVIAKLYTATGVFQIAQDIRVNVSVENFPTQQEAEVYAQAFHVKFVDGTLLRDEGKGSPLFDENSREVLESHVQFSEAKTSGSNEYDPVAMTIAQAAAQTGTDITFSPIAWHAIEIGS